MSEFDEKDGRKTTAYILLAVAGYLVLSNTGFLNLFGIGSLIRWAFNTLFSLLPVAILVLGIFWISRSKDGDKPIIPYCVALFGAVLVTSQFGLFGLSFGNMFLPMWLVVIAFIVMNPRDILPRRMNVQRDEIDEYSEKIKLVAFMGGGDLDYTSQSLQGGEIIAIWGGYNVDFTNADMKGDSMELNLLCIMGGCEITVPGRWRNATPSVLWEASA